MLSSHLFASADTAKTSFFLFSSRLLQRPCARMIRRQGILNAEVAQHICVKVITICFFIDKK